MSGIIEYLGYLAAVFLTVKIAGLTLKILRRQVFSSPLNVAKLGEWALVTGSTDGIGKAYAFALAKK